MKNAPEANQDIAYQVNRLVRWYAIHSRKLGKLPMFPHLDDQRAALKRLKCRSKTALAQLGFDTNGAPLSTQNVQMAA